MVRDSKAASGHGSNLRKSQIKHRLRGQQGLGKALRAWAVWWHRPGYKEKLYFNKQTNKLTSKHLWDFFKNKIRKINVKELEKRFRIGTFV